MKGDNDLNRELGEGDGEGSNEHEQFSHFSSFFLKKKKNR